MDVPSASQCSDAGHLWHLGEALHHSGGPRADDQCHCQQVTYETLPAGAPCKTVYVDERGATTRGPFPHTKDATAQ